MDIKKQSYRYACAQTTKHTYMHACLHVQTSTFDSIQMKAFADEMNEDEDSDEDGDSDDELNDLEVTL